MDYEQKENGQDLTGTIPTDEPYVLGTHNGQQFIQCLTCYMRSFNDNDIKRKYCGNCRRFHEF